MTTKVEVQAKNMHLSEDMREYVEQKSAKLEKHLQEIDQIYVELTHARTARHAEDRHVAQITARGKKMLLRTEERGDDLRLAFDIAFEKIQRQADRYKGKLHRGRGDGRSAAEVVPNDEGNENEDTGEFLPTIAKRKKFIVFPMNEDEAIEQMRLLGHNNFFVFFNPEKNSMQVLYRRRNGTYGLIEPIVG